MSIRDSLPCYVQSCLPDGRGGEQKLVYELLNELGSGGMGTVYRARHLNPPESYVAKHGDAPRIVAVKYLHRHIMLVSDEAVKRFVREALILQSVRHPNVVRIHSLGIDQEGIPFLAMELVENARSLATVRDIHAYRRVTAGLGSGVRIAGSLIPLKELVPILRQFLLALREVHAKDIVHRDIKPDNVLITKDGTVKLTDFGISKSLDLDKNPALTMQGRVVGTPYYVSPEAICGCRVDPRGDNWYVGQRSDIYSFGVMCYELMSGKQPFDADVSELPQAGKSCDTVTQAQLLASLVLSRVISDSYRPKPLASLLVDPNPVMVELVEACMAKGPWDRPASCDVILEVLNYVEEYEAGSSTLPDAGKISSLLRMSASSDIGLAPTQLDSVPPRIQDVNNEPVSIVVQPSGLEPQAPIPQQPAPASRISKLWIVAALILSGICGMTVWLAVQYPELFGTAPSATVTEVRTSPVPPPVTPSSKPELQKPDPGPAPGTRAYSVFQSGAASARQGDCRRASSQMYAILAAHPAFPKPYLILGDCARKSGNLEEARQNYRKYLGFEGVEPLPPQAAKIME